MTYNLYGSRTTNLSTSEKITSYAVIWYQNASNYLVANILWSGNDGGRCLRQVRNISINGYINGVWQDVHVVWGDAHSDPNGTYLPGLSGGYSISVVKAGGKFVISLTGGGETISGNATFNLTSGAYQVGVYGANDTFVIENFKVTGTVAQDVITTVNGLTKIANAAFGTMTITAPFKGTSTGNVTVDVAFGVKFWWDGNNYIEAYIQWKAGDRPHEINSFQISGTLNGAHAGWADKWLDGNGKKPANEGTLTVTINGNTITITLKYADGYTASHSRTLSLPSGNYSVEFFTWGEAFKVTNYTIYK